MPKQSLLFYSLMLGCLSLWLFLSSPYLIWFFRFLPLHFDLLHGLIAGLVIGLSLYKLKNSSSSTPSKTMLPLALVLCFVGLAGILFIRTQASIRIFGFSFSLILLYGLICPLMHAKTWKQGLFPFFLLLMTLPFGRHFDVFVGYPLRMGLVNLVNTSLQPFFPGLESYSGILVIENRASYVDVDCSGLRGLWVSWLMYLTLGWIEGVAIKGRWLLGFLLFSGWILLGNFIRIFMLVFIHTIWDKPELDPLIHQSISLFFLLSACYFAYLWMKSGKTMNASPASNSPAYSPSWPLGVSLVAMFLVSMTPVYSAKLKEQPDYSPFSSHLQKASWTKVELSEIEKDVFNREAVQSLKFVKDSLEVILVFDGDWNSQHKPELCYESAGIPIKSFQTKLLRNGLQIREIQFQERKEKAWYWFQQGTMSTSDFGQKVWTQVRGGTQRWTMVSILSKNGKIEETDIVFLYESLKNMNHHE